MFFGVENRNYFAFCFLAIFLFVESAVAGFVHPGARYGAYELDFVKSKIANGEEPWTSLLASAKKAKGNSRPLGLALAWYYTGDTAAADEAISIFKEWETAEPYEPAPANDGNQSSLEAAWAASVLAPAAEILSLYSGWNETDKNATRQMFRTVFLPALMQMSYWNGNVDLTQIDALLSTAVFLEDSTAWNEGVNRLTLRLPAYFYLGTDPASARSYAKGVYNWSAKNECKPLVWVDGVTQETCRDNGHHAQFAIAAALEALETAWIQGVDLYSQHQVRMISAMELLSLQLITDDMQGVCDGDVTSSRFNTLEVGYNHFHNRLGIDLPQTQLALENELRNGSQQFNMFYETLTNGNIVYDANSILYKVVPQNLMMKVFAENGSVRIVANGAKKIEVQIYDLNGNHLNGVKSIAFNDTYEFKINQKGVFVVFVKTEKGTFAKKVNLK